MPATARFALAAALLAASAAVAHQGVQNPAVLARMTAMSDMAEALKAVGLMVRGETPFDAGAVEEAVRTLRAEAAQTPGLFEARETDPRMEARPAIWENWDDFVEKSDALVARLGAPAPQTLEDARTWLADVGRDCAACHEPYRD